MSEASIGDTASERALKWEKISQKRKKDSFFNSPTGVVLLVIGILSAMYIIPTGSIGSYILISLACAELSPLLFTWCWLAGSGFKKIGPIKYFF